jgi:hypothetical protein
MKDLAFSGLICLRKACLLAANPRVCQQKSQATQKSLRTTNDWLK